jgi:hypothetical protein
MELFDLTKKIFEDPEGYKSVSKLDKRKNFFILQRRFAIAHPMQANALNALRINQESAVDVWQKFMNKHYKQTPGWMYTKGIKKVQKEKEQKANIPNAVIIEYAKRYHYDLKTVRDALKFYPKEMTKEIQAFEKLDK